jgi:hypothetical protein
LEGRESDGREKLCNWGQFHFFYLFLLPCVFVHFAELWNVSSLVTGTVTAEGAAVPYLANASFGRRER